MASLIYVVHVVAVNIAYIFGQGLQRAGYFISFMQNQTILDYHVHGQRFTR